MPTKSQEPGFKQEEIDAFFAKHPEAQTEEQKFNCLLKACLQTKPADLNKKKEPFKWKP